MPELPAPPAGGDAPDPSDAEGPAAVFDALADGALLMGPDGRITRANAVAARMLGTTTSLLTGIRIPFPGWQAFREDGRPWPGEEWPSATTRRTGNPVRRARMRVRGPHQERWLEISTQPLPGPAAGPPFPVLVTFADVTGQVAADQGRRVRERGELVGVISHELRTPLGTVDGMLALLAEEPGLSPDGRARLDAARARLARVRRMADDLLVMAQLDAGALDLMLSDIDLGALVDQLAREALPEAGRRGLHLEVHARRTMVRVDADRIAQVVDNLLSNALKFSPRAGTVRIGVAGDLDRARVRVADEGPGIGPDERERVFERFRRGAGSKAVPGSGLGLPIALAIVEAHGGRILLEPAGDRGLAAVVELPRD